MDVRNKNTRGNRLFLPKIEYTRLENNTPTIEPNEEIQGINFNEDTETTSEGSNYTNKRNVGLCEKQSKERPSVSFTKFSVLPPIRSIGTTTGKYYKSLSEDNFDDEQLSGRNAVSLLRRQPALYRKERQDEATNNKGNLQIVGQSYKGNFQPSILDKRKIEHLIPRRPSSTPQIGNKQCSQDSDLRTQRLTKFKRFNSESSQDSVPIYRDTSSVIQSNENNMLLLSPPELKRKGLLSVSSQPSRPVSRCHININMNDTEAMNIMQAKESENRSYSVEHNALSQDTADCDFDNRSLSAPLVQFSNEDNDSKTSSIQVLIDTLETAKTEIPEKLELPKMSVREQRRRSALCRVNSKQVDDFLLVHNLKDLGLL